MSDSLVSLLIILGSFFVLTAGIGIARFSETMFRAHALSKALTLGLTLILVALFGVIGSYAAGVKVTLAVLFQFVTIPIAGHIFALYIVGPKP